MQQNKTDIESCYMQNPAILFCSFVHLYSFCNRKSLEMGMIIKDLCPHIVHTMGFLSTQSTEFQCGTTSRG